MKIGTRFVIGNLLVFGLAFLFFLYWLTNEIAPEYRKAAEEPMVDASRILASIAAETAREGRPDAAAFKNAFRQVQSAPFEARIYDYVKSSVDFRVYMTDEDGIVLFDSHNAVTVGKDFSFWRDVDLTLSGKYGARTTRDDPSSPNSSVMYVASPIVLDGKTIGVLSLGKPTEASNVFIAQSRQKVLLSGAAVCILIILVTYVLSHRVVRPITLLTDYAHAVRDGQRARMPELGKDETAVLGTAFEEMRETLEGKKYVERYLQAFTHEVKSPLSAIKGALELLKEEMPEDQKKRFIQNVENEAGRIHEITEKLLLLSNLENTRTMDMQENVTCKGLIDDALKSLRIQVEKQDISVSVDAGPDCRITADPFWATHCVINLMKNSLDFSPPGGRIVISTETDGSGNTVISVRDEGSGVPEYAIGKVHERFFSLKRPRSRKKSTGLGLSIVNEVMQLHGGGFRVENLKEGGALASLIFPAYDNVAEQTPS